MVRIPPIRLLTPPIKDPLTRRQSGRTQTGGSGGGSGSDAPSFESIFSEMLKTYLPETVSFTPLDEDVLRDTISNWLRPAYEQAIRSRQERTERQNAELDADALARGMGTSTYVTDVKDRAFRSEAQDVDDLESDYASTLAGQLYDAMRAQQEQKIDVDKFNAEQINRAREKAAAAAQALYSAYHRSGGGRAGAQSEAQDGRYPLIDAMMSGAQPAESTDVDYRTAANLLSRLSPEQRRQFYAGEGAYAQSYAQIRSSLGRAAFEQLMAQFPAA
ncbi:MAG: hypothetical protein IKD54_02300 [Clostridia bacterium]|nr:hypothetical protein [Clostridia bacterium]MBR2644106.1 hypothetical protein [Clostridia bacterium]MBR3037208.1 hypothetical protein [Clostridia bacterium]MBR3129198.1 hypothetical protein [Clostridia bacterium]